MSKEAAKDLVAKIAADDDFRSKVEQAATKEEKQAVLADAGFRIIAPDDLIELQSEIEQKGMIGDLAGWMGESLVRVGFDPAGVGAEKAKRIGQGIGSAADLVVRTVL